MKNSQIFFMRISILIIFSAIVFISCSTHEEDKKYPLEEVSLQEVKITGGFWAPFIETSRNKTIPHILKYCEESGRIDNFAIAGGIKQGAHKGERYNDTDVFKTIEGISYHLQNQKNDRLEIYVDSVISLISAAQEEDGYLFTPRTIDPETSVPGGGHSRWEDVWISHELYNAGHLYEAAVAYYEATGKRVLLDVALKNADLVISVFNENGLKLAPGHQEIEIGLSKLYQLTGEEKYLNQAIFFLKQRGQEVKRDPEPEGGRFEIYNDPEYLQYHLPVEKQKEAVGHAVRAMYMYSGMTDAGYFGKDSSMIETLKALWEDIVSSKLYITGGVGASHKGEAFSKPFLLPNETAYCETCAAAGSIFWNHRMFNLSSETKYMDLLEITLYNGLLSGVSLDGKSFFYPNPLESKGKYQRSEWFGVACCPGNIARIIPSLGKYIYSKSDHELFVNLFIESISDFSMNNNKIHIEQKTDYPQSGKVKLTISPDESIEFTLNIRIPGWLSDQFLPGNLYRYQDNKTSSFSVNLNGEKINTRKNGYLRIDRVWNKGDIVEIEFPVSPRIVIADSRVEEDRGKAALVMGPIVYATEGIDNGGSTQNIQLSSLQKLTSEYDSSILNGIEKIHFGDYIAIPYFSWANRGASDMKVWIPFDK